MQYQNRFPNFYQKLKTWEVRNVNEGKIDLNTKVQQQLQYKFFTIAKQHLNKLPKQLQSLREFESLQKCYQDNILVGIHDRFLNITLNYLQQNQTAYV